MRGFVLSCFLEATENRKEIMAKFFGIKEALSKSGYGNLLRYRTNDILKKQLAPEIKKIQSRQVERTVYNVYKPKVYKRRGADGGGLGDVRNMISEVSEIGTLSITNVTPTDPYISYDGVLRYSKNQGEPLAPIVEEGHEYDFSSDGKLGYDKPRKFIENTRKELKVTKAHVKILKKAFAKHFNVE